MLHVQVRLAHVEGYRLSFLNDLTVSKQAQDTAHAHFLRMQELAAELTSAEERLRRELAIILHDELGQRLFAATAQLIAIRDRSGDLREPIDAVLQLLDQVGRSARELTFEICPPELTEMGLAAALKRLVAEFPARYSIAATFIGEGAGPQDLNARGLLYHGVRELLTNVAKHARAKSVQVRQTQSDGQIQIEVHDDGEGFDATAMRPGDRGFGLFHLRQRLELFGGSLTIESSSGSGSNARLLLPLAATLKERG
jgi:signal transduction histidine kinase